VNTATKTSLELFKLTAKNGHIDVIRDLMKTGASVKEKKTCLGVFHHSSREQTFEGSATVVESSCQLRQLDFTDSSSLAMHR
jgi:hypothetical protein